MGSPYLVQTAWSVVTQLVKDWQKNPSMLFTEHDVQAELYSRLKATLHNLGRFWVADKPNNRIIEKRSQYLWARISCEPSIIYEWEQKPAYMKPDIVLWDDLNAEKYTDIEDRYSRINDGTDNWPILWVCEIKYAQDIPIEKTSIDEIIRWFESGKKEEGYNWDIKKMETLVSHGEKGKPYFGTQYAAVLNLVKIIAPGDGIYWDPEFKGKNGKLWMLHAYLPQEMFCEYQNEAE